MSKKYVWIVDDDPIFRMIFSMAIHKAASDKYHTREFENGQLALDALLLMGELDETTPQYIFLDINMPVLNGWQFLESMDSSTQNFLKEKSTVFIVSSSINPEDQSKAMEFGVVSDYLVKPITADKLKTIFSVN